MRQEGQEILLPQKIRSKSGGDVSYVTLLDTLSSRHVDLTLVAESLVGACAVGY